MRPARLAVGACGAAVVLLHALVLGRFLPTAAGTVGHDHSYFLPLLLNGAYWVEGNGPFAVPWFTPAFLGGVPFYPNPQNPYHSLPQALALVVDPLAAVRVTGVLACALGFAGAYACGRRALGLSRPAAVLGAGLFALNGAFAARLLIGHLPFHAGMLAPWLALCLLARPERRSAGSLLRRGAGAGAALAYCVLAGDLYDPPAMLLAALGLLGLQALRGRARVGTALARLGVALVAGPLLCAAKLAALLAFLASFPRDGYPLPGATGVGGAVALAARAVFAAPPAELAREVLAGGAWTLERHELEYGVGPAAGLLVALGAAAWLVRAARGAGPSRARLAGGLALLGTALAVPLALNVRAPAWPAWTELLEGTPLLGSASNLVRLFAAFVPLAALGAGLAVDGLARSPRARLALAAAALGLTAALFAAAERDFYAEQPYRPERIVAAWRALRAGGGVPPVERFEVYRDAEGRVALPVGRNDSLARGGSQLAAVEPIFGYRLEWLPARGLATGDPLRPSATEPGRLVVRDPACFVFPRANGCEPGSGFRAERVDAARAFLAYRPYPFELPARQRAAGAANLAALAALPALVLAGRRARRRARAGG